MGREDQIGVYADIVARREAILAANAGRMSPAALSRIAKPKPKKAYPEPAVVLVMPIKPDVAGTVYSVPQHPLRKIIQVVCDQSRISAYALCGEGRTVAIVNARFAVANLSEEFAARLSGSAVDRALRGYEGTCNWRRERHTDRLAMYPLYHSLWHVCRNILLSPSADGDAVRSQLAIMNSNSGVPLSPQTKADASLPHLPAGAPAVPSVQSERAP